MSMRILSCNLLAALFGFFPLVVSADGNQAESAGTGSADTGHWQEIQNEEGILVYKRSYRDSKFKEFRGEITVNSSLASFVALLLDADEMSSWMYRTVEVKELESIAPNERIAYMAFDFAPLPDRDIVVRNKVTQDPDELKVTYSMEVVPGHSALGESGLSHISSLDGFVTAEPVGDGKVRIVYQVHIEPGSALMKFPLLGPGITNSLLSATPFHTLKKAREKITEKAYQDASFDFIKEPEGAAVSLQQNLPDKDV